MKKLLLTGVLLSTAAVSVSTLHAQAVSVNGGAIQGTITDPSGAIVPNAEITITSVDTTSARKTQTDAAGFYSVGPLNPGNYVIAVSAPGFQRLEVRTRVLTGTSVPGSYKLTLGSSAETVEVSTGDIQVNTDQAGVSDVITREQIATLPVNGRNFLDLAQIEPGVQLQNGTTFDPTKSGYTGISVNGVSGRTTRIVLDGTDISDEYVGTTVMNVSTGSINEFQLNRSTQDVAGEVTSQGQVLVSTRSGTNVLHGQAFYQFQDQRALYANPISTGLKIPPVFQRNQVGLSIGGPLIKDKLFGFGNVESLQQKAGAPNGLGSVFSSTAFATANPTINSPFKQNYSAVRLDYTGPFGGHYFARGSYNYDSSVTGTNYSVYVNRDNTYSGAFGADFGHGRLTHSFRGGYLKFHNFIVDAVGSSGAYNPVPGLQVRYTAQAFQVGPNANAPQETFQSDKQLRYDGSYTVGSHNVRFGGSMNRILGSGAAGFYSNGPRVTISASTLLTGTVTATNPLGLGCGGVTTTVTCPDDPLRGYMVGNASGSSTLGGFRMSNGLAAATEYPGFNKARGGLTAWRAAGYLSDSWKITPSFSMSGGIRYTLDTNRENNDLNPLTCGDLLTNVAYTCNGLSSTTPLSSLFDPSFTGRVKQPVFNFGPQLGFVYSPGNHKTVLRGGFGVFFENVVFNNQTNARKNLLRNAISYAVTDTACSNYSVTYADGTPHTASPDGTPLRTLCTQRSVAQASSQLIALSKDYQANAAANPALNANYVGANLSFSGVHAQPFRTPYAEQWNFGIQRELYKGAVLSADYIHNSALKIGQTVDINRAGAARTFNQANAVAAINRAAAANACAAPTPQAAVACLVSKNVKMTTLAGQGLDSGATYAGATNYVYAGKPGPAAFPGLNQNLGSGAFIRPTGRSGYDALQIVFHQSKSHPFKGVDNGNIQISYNLSRIVSNLSSSDQFFTAGAYDTDNATRYIGRNNLDRKHQLSFGGSFTFKYGPQLGVIGHFFSALPGTLTLDNSTAAGAIFQSDLTGDGTTGDIAPGTNPGSYMHDVHNTDLPGYISQYNATYAGQITPAGQALVNSGLFTQAQLTSMGAVVQPILQSATRGLNNPMFRSVDANFSYPIRLNRLHEGMSLEPSIAFYNVFNLSNFTSYTGTLLNAPTTGAVNATAGYFTSPDTFAALNSRRVLRGAGTFSQGAARQAEFALKLNF